MLIIPRACLAGLFSDLRANTELDGREGRGGTGAFRRSASAPRLSSGRTWLFATAEEQFTDKGRKC